MKKHLFISFILFYTLNLSAQERIDSIYLYAGLNIKADKNNLWEADLRFINKKLLHSAGIRYTTFNYITMDGVAEVMSDLSGVKHHVGYQYDIHGFSIKPGWIPLVRLTPKSIMSLGVYAVFTHATHDFSFIFSDVAGETRETYSENIWNYGAEFEWHLGIRILKRGNIGASMLLGYRETESDVLNNTVMRLNGYARYTPAQGYGSSPIYVNFMITSGFSF
jgi:hypothetical protein